MSEPVVANTLGPRLFFQHLSQNYENEYWEFEKKLGFGGFGFTALVRRKKSTGEPSQRMAVKFAVGVSFDRQQSLRDEIKTLKVWPRLFPITPYNWYLMRPLESERR